MYMNIKAIGDGMVVFPDTHFCTCLFLFHIAKTR